MIQSPPCQVLGDSVGWNDAIYPQRYFIWLVYSDVSGVRIHDEHLVQYIASITARRLHERDRPVWMKAVIEFQRGVNEPAIRKATQVDMSYQVLIEDRPRQVGN